MHAGLVSVVVPAHWAAVRSSCLSITRGCFSGGARWPVMSAKVHKGQKQEAPSPMPTGQTPAWTESSHFRTAILTAPFYIAFKSFVLSKVQVRLLAITVLFSSGSDTSSVYCLLLSSPKGCGSMLTTLHHHIICFEFICAWGLRTHVP